MDLSSLESVKEFVKVFTEKYDRLDVLVNNAGIMACPKGTTKDGFETQMGCNHFAHFYLFTLLTPLLLKTAETTGKPSRFVALSSCAAAEMSAMSPGMADIDFDDIMWETREYNEESAYQQSKLANYLHAKEAAKRYPADKLISVGLHPGWVLSNLDVHAFKKAFGDNWFGTKMAAIVRKIFLWKGDMITAVDGAQTSLYCVLEDAKKMESGAFYSQFGAYKDKAAQNGGWPMQLPNPNATPENATKLWEVSEKIIAEKGF